MKNSILNLSLVGLFLLPVSLFANTKDAPHVPIGHCYHWLNEGSQRFLTYKYNYAQNNQGELTFYTTGGNGAVAGPGLYCAKTPGDSYSYGDRLIRIDFVDDIVMLDELTGIQYCGKKGNFYPTQAECQSKPWDIKFYYGGGVGKLAWYVIRNPQAVQLWSANSDQLISDLNAEKPFELASYSMHADATIALMRAESVRMGTKIFSNPNARLSIVKILKDPSKLAQIPPLTVIALAHNYLGADLSDATKRTVYSQQFARALKDTKLTFADVINVTKLNSAIETAFTGEIKKLDLANLSGINPVLVLQAVDRFDGAIAMTPQKIRDLWRSAILSAGDLASLVDTTLKKNGSVAKGLDTSVPTRAELQSKLTSYNLISFLKILNLYVDQGSSPVLQDSFKYLVKELMIKGVSFADTFDKLDNSKLAKESALASVLVNEILPTATSKNVDPIALGLALDRTKDSLDDGSLTAAKTKVLGLALQPDANRLTYQILEDLQEGKFNLPTFYPESTFMIKLLDRSVKERSLSKTPTNTFRMVMTGFFSYYNSKIRREKDPKKKAAISQQAASDFFAMADVMNTPERAPFYYITVQNASYFKGNGQYNNHPIDTAFEQYKSGDTNFDLAFEGAIKESFDGSILQYLIYNGEKDKNAVTLLKLYLGVLLDPKFDNILSDAQFVASQAEKKTWSNFVNTTHYSPWENTRVPSNICHVATVALKYNDELSKVTDSKTAAAMKDWAQDLNRGFCKK